MLIELNRKDINLVISESVPGYELYDGTSYKIHERMNIEAPLGFAKDVVSPLLNAFAHQNSSSAFASPHVCSEYAIELMDQHTGELHFATWFALKKSKNWAQVFNIFNTYGINLNVLHIVVYEDNGILKMFVSSKIAKLLSQIDSKSQQTLAGYLLYIVKTLSALSKSNMTISAPSVNNSDARFGALSDEFECFEETFAKVWTDSKIDISVLDTDITFRKIVYRNGNTIKVDYTKIVNTLPAEGIVYNTITVKKKNLIIVNTLYNPKMYYVISGAKSVIYTNGMLAAFNTVTDSSEFIPALVRNIIDAYNPGDISIVHLPTNEIFAGVKSATIDADAEGFTELLDKYPMITENYDNTLYEGMLPKKVLSATSSSANLAEEYKDDALAQVLYAKNPAYFETFDLKELSTLPKGIASSDASQIYSALFYGESGTGKSDAARVIFQRAGLPWIAINCSMNIDEADIFGSMIPNPQKSSTEDPEFIWKDGPATVAIRNGYGCIFEEFNAARPGVLMKLNSLLDQSRQIDLGNGEILKAHKNFRIILTANIGYEGTLAMNPALIDRCNICHEFGRLSKRDTIELVKKRIGYTDDAKLSTLYDVYEAVNKYSKENNLGLVTSVRRLFDLCTKGKYFKNAKDAVSNLLLNHAFLQESEHLRYFKESVLEAFDLSFKI